MGEIEGRPIDALLRRLSVLTAGRVPIEREGRT